MAGSFLRVACPECDRESTVFGKAAQTVACPDCDTTLVTPTGGKATVHGDVLETVEHRPEDPAAEIRFDAGASSQ
jgi:small subunit ribosomal protein S27e